MSSTSDAILNGIALGLYNTANIDFGALTSRSVYNAGIDPFFSFNIDLDSPSGFSSSLHPSYATPSNVAYNVSGYDTTWAPLTSAITDSFITSPLLGRGFSGRGLFGFGFNNWFSTDTYISSSTWTPLGVRPGNSGWWC